MSDLVKAPSRFIVPSRLRQVGPPTVAAAIPLFLDTLGVGRSERTRLTYRTALHRLCDWLQVVGLDPDQTLTTELPPTVGEEFMVALAGAYTIKATAANYTAGFKAFLRFLYRRRWGPAGTTYEEANLGIRELTGRFLYRSRQPDARLDEVIQRVLMLPETSTSTRADTRLGLLRDRALFVLLQTSGLRVSELVSLNRSILTDEYPEVLGKGGKPRAVFVGEQARELLEVYLAARRDDSPALLCSHHRSGGHGQSRRGAARPDNRLTQQGAWLIVRKHSAALGAVITPHQLRHRFARDLRKAGVSMADISDLLGHSSVATTHRIYARVDTAHLQAAYAQYEATRQPSA